jgi:uncharacterized protein (UPF0248 family)
MKCNKRIISNNIGILVILLTSVLLIGSCSKNDSDSIDDYDTEEYSVVVSDYGNDKYSREVRIKDYSKAQKLKWMVLYQDESSMNYFRIYPTEGTGSGSFMVRLKDPNIISYDCPLDIFFTTASGKTSIFSPHVSFSHLQKLYNN